MLSRRYRASWQRRSAVCSGIAGALYAAEIATAGAPHGSLSLFAGVSVALLWVALATTGQARVAP